MDGNSTIGMAGDVQALLSDLGGMASEYSMALLLIPLLLWVVWRLSARWASRKDVRGQQVLITGGAMGLGRELAMEFARKGANIILWDLRDEPMQKTAQELRDATGCEVHCFVCDVSNRKMVYRVAKETKDTVGAVDVLVNNAGIVFGRKFFELTDNQIRRTMEVDAMACFWTIRAFLPDMIERNQGHIISISSVAGLVGGTTLTDYCAAKFAVTGLHEALRMELRHSKRNVGATMVCPFFIKGPMFAGLKWHLDPWFPLMEASYVARCAVDAMRSNKERVVLPRRIALLPTLLHLLPAWLYDVLMDYVFRSHSAMSEFKGRGDRFSLASLGNVIQEADEDDDN